MNEQAQPRRAVERHGWRIHWIWSVPIAAVGLVAWLAVRSWSQSGPEVRVIFPEIANLRAGDTKVEFEGMQVGEVEDVKLEPDLRHMRATLQLHPDMAGHLGAGTKFWIIGKQVSFSSPSGLKALITGVSIGILPSPGHGQDSYQGLSDPPVLGFGAKGTLFRLHADTLGSVQRGTPIYFAGEKVGEVAHTGMTQENSPTLRGFTIEAFIDAPFDHFVHQGSRFWSAGPVHISSGGGGPSLQFQSIPALFEGAIDFETPDGPIRGPVAAAGTTFRLYGGEDEAENAPDSEGVAYRAVFSDASGVPGVDAPVTLMGKRVGAVSDASLEYDPSDGKLRVDTTIVLEPRNIALAGGARWTDPRAQMDDMLRHLIAQGLHAGLSASPPVIGGQQVALSISPGKKGVLGPGPVPEIPSQEGGGGVAGILLGANQFVAQLNGMKLDRIADNLQQITKNAAKFSNSPALANSLRAVDRSTSNLQHITAQIRTELPPSLAELRRTIAEAQASLASAKDLLSSQGSAASAPGSEGLPETLYEISNTARSLRELVNFLDRHPSALLTGRGAEQ